MFIIGAELRLPGGIRTARAAVFVGLSVVDLPMALALGIAPVLYTDFAPAGVALWPFALFTASAVAITAMPAWPAS
jgi:Kef-type K+ transport system membrane component KefB